MIIDLKSGEVMTQEVSQELQERRQKLVAEVQMHSKDTGSSEVQVALLTERMNELNKHLATHKKDFSSRRGLMALVAQRRNLLDYLKRVSVERYEAIIAKLGIRK